MDEMDFTRKFRLGDQRDLEIKAILTTVYRRFRRRAITQSIRSWAISSQKIPPISPTTITPGR